MTDSTNVNALAEKFGIYYKTVKRLIEESKLEPILKVKVGNRTLIYYDKVNGEAVIAAHLAAEAQKIRPASVPPLQAAPVVSLSGVESKLSILDVSLAEVKDSFAQVSMSQETLQKQNIILLRQMECLMKKFNQMEAALGIKAAP